VFVTIDAGLPYQQDLGRLPLAIVLLKAPTNRLDAPLLSLVPGLLEQLFRHLARSGPARR
jgi:hypothetical protein